MDQQRSPITAVKVGIGGWTFAPWRGTFYPPGLPQARELAYAASRLSTLEINGTFYGPQKPATFAKWRDQTPDEFVFAVKAPRYATHRRDLGAAGRTVDEFIRGGVLELKHKLGPINWQLMPTTKFDPQGIEAFFALLPQRCCGRELRHAIEVRHASFLNEHFIELARRHGISVIIAGDSAYPHIAEVTGEFVYIRIMGTRSGHKLGYAPAALDGWARRIEGYAASGRSVYVYVIAGCKESNPAAAEALQQRLGAAGDAASLPSPASGEADR